MTIREIPVTTLPAGLAALLLALPIGWALAPSLAAASGSPSTKGNRAAAPPALSNGHELWATIDVCSSTPSPLLGVRGSMPSGGQRQETMYMLFTVQYLDTKTKQWTNLPKGSQSTLVKVGTASATRQAGRTFELAAPPHGGSFQLRGIVEFQWRRGSKVTLSTTRPTTSGHPSAAGAVPRGFSAATCTIH
jgi:hypothetical protein